MFWSCLTCTLGECSGGSRRNTACTKRGRLAAYLENSIVLLSFSGLLFAPTPVWGLWQRLKIQYLARLRRWIVWTEVTTACRVVREALIDTWLQLPRDQIIFEISTSQTSEGHNFTSSRRMLLILGCASTRCFSTVRSSSYFLSLTPMPRYSGLWMNYVCLFVCLFVQGKVFASQINQ